MAALARPGDDLWTPEPVDDQRALLAHSRGVRLLSGSRPTGLYSDVLCWGQVPWVSALRPQAGSNADRGPKAPVPVSSTDVVAAVWRACPGVEYATVIECNDRRYAFAINRDLGLALPGAAILSSVAELERHLRAGGHEFGCISGSESAQSGSAGRGAPTWVLEAPFSASGRFRLRRRGAVLDEPARTRARRLFATFGQLVFQPWVERVEDFGCVGLITGADDWSIIGQHVLETNDAGVFRGISVSPTRMRPEHLVAYDTAREVARRMARVGYRGVFGTDGFLYRDPDGRIRVYPMCEINARMTFGFLVHALAHEHHASRAWLHVDAGPAPERARGQHAIALLSPGPDDPTSAWFFTG